MKKFLHILPLILLTVVIVFTFFALSSMFESLEEVEATLTKPIIFLACSLFFLASVFMVYFINKKDEGYSLRNLIYFIGISLSFLTLFTSFFFSYGLAISTTIFYLGLIGGNIYNIIKKRKARTIISNILLILIFGSIGISMAASYETPDLSILIHIIILQLGAIFLLLREAFAKIQFRKLEKIIRKTYAAEILLGFIALIISFSLIFSLLDGLKFGDALWYSFALVTTIGFGDVQVTSPISRVLSVILGIYGIIVVAVITSIIVNFYNEIKNDDENDK